MGDLRWGWLPMLQMGTVVLAVCAVTGLKLNSGVNEGVKY